MLAITMIQAPELKTLNKKFVTGNSLGVRGVAEKYIDQVILTNIIA